MLWVSHRIWRIENRTSDEEVIKERKLKIWEENKKVMKVIADEMKKERRKWVYIKIENIHFNPPGKLTLKSNSFLAIWSKIAT